MKNLNTHSTLVLSREELRSINGGGFWRDLGRAIGRAWCWMKNYRADDSDRFSYVRLKMGGL